jgi:hypothetical protein
MFGTMEDMLGISIPHPAKAAGRRINIIRIRPVKGGTPLCSAGAGPNGTHPVALLSCLPRVNKSYKTRALPAFVRQDRPQTRTSPDHP